MQNYNKYKKLNNVTLFLSFSLFALFVFNTFTPPLSGQSNSNHGWELASAAVLIVSIEMPIAFVKSKYFEQTIREYNRKKF